MSRQDILEKLYGRANENLDRGYIRSNGTEAKIEKICRCGSNKAPIRFLMSCLSAKIDRPDVDIRKPYTEIAGKDSYSGRHYDESIVEPFVHKYGLPCNSTTAYLTPAFRNHDRLLTTDLVLVGRPREIYTMTLQILDLVHMEYETPESVLQEILRQLSVIKREDELRMSQLIAELKQTEDVLPLSGEEIVALIAQHLNCKNSSRLPVLIVASAYQAVKDLIEEENRPLEAHNAADKQTGSIGDVEVIVADDDNIVTCYEMKDKRVTRTDIDVALQKLSKTAYKIDNYLFITTDVIEMDVDEYAKSLYEKTGVEFAIMDCLGFIRHFLHFFHRRRNRFLNTYQDMVLSEPASSVPQPLKEAFLALRRVAESNRT